MYEALERPSAEDPSARLSKALVESLLAPRFLEGGLVRNAAGEASRVRRAVLAALPRLGPYRFKAAAKTEEERRRLEGKAAPRVPTSRTITLSLMEELAYADISYTTAAALDLHGYHHHGPHPHTALSKHRTEEEAAVGAGGLVRALVKYAEALRDGAKRTEEYEKALSKAKRRPGRP